MKSRRMIDVVARALQHNTAVTLITTFGCDNSVMVVNASTNQFIATVRRLREDADRYEIKDAGAQPLIQGYTHIATTLSGMPGFPRGASKSRNYSRPVLREGVVL